MSLVMSFERPADRNKRSLAVGGSSYLQLFEPLPFGKFQAALQRALPKE